MASDEVWNKFVENLTEDIKVYCKQNKINFEESLSDLKAFIESEDDYLEEGPRDEFIPKFIKMYDSDVDIHDKRTCIDRLSRYEPFLRNLCFMKFPDKDSEINNLSAAELIKRLNLIEDNEFWTKKNNDYPNDSFNHHLYIMYNARNNESHHWDKLNERELYDMRFTIAVFYIEVISKLQNLLRKAGIFPEETIEYYAKYIDKNGIPFGIRKLTEEQVKHKNSSYKFIIKDNKLVKVIHINSLGNPYEANGSLEDPVIQEIFYSDDDTIKIKCTNSTGKKINFVKEYKKNSATPFFNRLNYYRGDGNLSFHLLNDSSARYSTSFDFQHINSPKANISGIKIERNPDGFIIKELFLKYLGEDIPQCDKEGISGYEYELNGNGLIEKQYFLDKNRNRMKCPKGDFFVSQKYNSLYEIEEVLVHDKHGDIKYFYKYDSYGNLIQRNSSFADKTSDKEKFVYNSKGQRTERLYFNGGSRVYCNQHFHREVTAYDENGYFSSSEYYGINMTDRVIADVNGGKCWKIKTNYNDFGFLTSEEYYDCEENPCLGISGSFKIEYDYDDSGNLTEEKYYGTDGKLKCDNLGAAIVRKKYRDNELIEELYFDENHKPVLNGNLWHKVTFQYYKGEQAENIEEISFFGINSKPKNSNDGRCKEKIIYDGRGLIIGRYYFNDNGEKGDNRGLYHTTFEYDAYGNQKKESYFNAENELIRIQIDGNVASYAIHETIKSDLREEEIYKDENNNGIEKHIKLFDENGNVISLSKYDIKNSKEKHISTINMKYDDKDRLIEQYYTNESGDVIEAPDGGYYYIKVDYWEDNKKKCEKYYDKMNNLIYSPGFKCAYWINKYDSYNNILERCFFDTNDKPVQIDDNPYVGYKIDYDSFSRPIAQYYLDRCKRNIYYIRINYSDEVRCRIKVYNKHQEKTEEYDAKYNVRTDSKGTVYSFDSKEFGNFKIVTIEK